jgi:hypothetical protein
MGARAGNVNYTRLRAALGAWAEHCPRPLVVLIDEIDALRDNVLVSVLRRVRAGYPLRPERFPWSVALVGLRDVRAYEMRGSEEGRLDTASPLPGLTKSGALRDSATGRPADARRLRRARRAVDGGPGDPGREDEHNARHVAPDRDVVDRLLAAADRLGWIRPGHRIGRRHPGRWSPWPGSPAPGVAVPHRVLSGQAGARGGGIGSVRACPRGTDRIDQPAPWGSGATEAAPPAPAIRRRSAT